MPIPTSNNYCRWIISYIQGSVGSDNYQCNAHVINSEFLKSILWTMLCLTILCLTILFVWPRYFLSCFARVLFVRESCSSFGMEVPYWFFLIMNHFDHDLHLQYYCVHQPRLSLLQDMPDLKFYLQMILSRPPSIYCIIWVTPR